MLLRILINSFLRRPKVVLLVFLSITMGAAIATAFLGIYGEISHKMALELRSYGANILVEPVTGDAGGELREADLHRIKTVFWKYNITGFAPYLFGVADFSARGGHRERGVLTGTWFAKSLVTEGEEPSLQGVKIIAPWWDLVGSWPAGPEDAVVGASLARRLKATVGGEVLVAHQGKEQHFKVVGIVSTGGFEEEQLFAPLATVQSLLAKEGTISRVLVSALTVPMDDFGRRDPASMSKLEYEKWYCTAYVTSVAKNIEEVMRGGRARPIWQIASAEGSLLKKLNVVMILLTSLALIASAIAVATTLMASLTERSGEIALMKTMGADRLQIAAIFSGETMLISLFGGIAGYLLGDQLAGFVSRAVFASTIKSPFWLLPTALLAAFAVAMLGGIVPLRRALVIEPVKILKG
jgi:putative ABC transport system permease protein